MLLAMTRDGVMAAILAVGIAVAFLAYNIALSIQRRYKVVRRDEPDERGKWN